MTATCADPPFVFLHVPRTGGFAFYDYLARHLPEADILASSPERTHMTAAQALGLWPDRPAHVVIRNPWEVYASAHAWYVHMACLSLDHWEPALRAGAERIYRAARLHLPAWVQWAIDNAELAGPEGFSGRYAPAGVTAHRYGPHVYQRMQRAIGIPVAALRHLNAMGRHGQWTTAAIDAIAAHHARDIARWHFRPPLNT